MIYDKEIFKDLFYRSRCYAPPPSHHTHTHHRYLSSLSTYNLALTISRSVDLICNWLLFLSTYLLFNTDLRCCIDWQWSQPLDLLKRFSGHWMLIVTYTYIISQNLKFIRLIKYKYTKKQGRNIYALLIIASVAIK